MVEVLRRAILHEGCVFKPISELAVCVLKPIISEPVVTDMTQCTFEENPVNRELAEEFNQKHESTSQEVRRRNLILPLAVSMTVSLLLSITINDPFFIQYADVILKQ
jgi:hypothetical protein